MTRRQNAASDQVARSFYAMLKREGFDNKQVLDLATQLLELVANDLQATATRPAEMAEAK